MIEQLVRQKYFMFLDGFGDEPTDVSMYIFTIFKPLFEFRYGALPSNHHTFCLFKISVDPDLIIQKEGAPDGVEPLLPRVTLKAAPLATGALLTNLCIFFFFIPTHLACHYKCCMILKLGVNFSFDHHGIALTTGYPKLFQ